MNKQNKVLNTLTWPLALVMIFTLHSCDLSGIDAVKGDGNLEIVTGNLSDFNRVEIGGLFDVILVAGSAPSYSLEMDQNLLDFIEIQTRGNTLYIETTKEAAYNPTKAELTIYYTHLNSISVSGACQLQSENVLSTNNMEIFISGAAKIDLEMDVESLTTVVSGAATIQLKGQADKHTSRLSGASHLRAETLYTKETSIELSGAGAAHIHASSKLRAVMSGVGSIRYYGNPPDLIVDRSGLGSVKSAE